MNRLAPNVIETAWNSCISQTMDLTTELSGDISELIFFEFKLSPRSTIKNSKWAGIKIGYTSRTRFENLLAGNCTFLFYTGCSDFFSTGTITNVRKHDDTFYLLGDDVEYQLKPIYKNW